jgi:hypothetical protein
MKLQNISNQIVRNVLGVEVDNNFLFQPADGTRGGLLLAARDSIYSLQQLQMSTNTITTQVLDCRSNLSWTITTVYGP